jgi:transcriptional regulator with XRE-family HTH domain
MLPPGRWWMTSLGPTLRSLRSRAGLSQEGLADLAGLSARTVSDLERGIHQRARRDSIRRIADALDLAPAERRRFEQVASGLGTDAGLPAELIALRQVDLVGRSGELDELCEAALPGPPGARTILVHGEGGIGKSRLVAELGARAIDAGRLVLHTSIESGPRGTLQPLVDLVQQAMRAVGRTEAAEGGLALLVPDRSRALGPPGSADVVDAVNALLAEAFADRRGLLVADDLALAEPALWSWARQTIVSLVDADVSIVLVARTGAPGAAGREVDGRLARLERLTAVRRFAIEGMGPGDGTALACTHGVTRRLGLRVHEASAGNPLAIGLLARHLSRSGPAERERVLVSRDPWIDAPDEADALVGIDVDRLSDAAQAVLGAAAVLGRDFTTADLAQVLDARGEDLDGPLDQAAALGIIEPDPGRAGLSWRFTHPIVRALVRRRVGPARRARLHDRVAALRWPDGDPLPTGPDLEVTAEHLLRGHREGEPTDRLHRATAAAGRRASSLHAWDEAASWWAHAARFAPAPARPAALLEVGVHRVRALQRHLARPVLVEAAALASAAGDRETVVAAADWYARMTKAGAADPSGLPVWRAALDRWGDDPSARVALGSALAIDHHLAGDLDGALELAADLDAPGPDGTCAPVGLITRSMVLWSTPRAEERLDLADLLLGSADTADEIWLEGLELKGVPLLQTGRRLEFEALLEDLDEAGRAADHLLARAQVTQWRALLALLDGDLAAAAAQADRVLDLAPDAPNFAEGWAAQHAAIARAAGRQATFLDRLLEMAPQRPAWAAMAAAVSAEVGDPVTARRLLAELWSDGADRIGWDWTRVVSLALSAEAAARTASVELLPAIEHALAPYAGQLVVVASGTSCEGPVDGYLALAARARGDEATARERFDRARDLAQRVAPALVDRVTAWSREPIGPTDARSSSG